MNDATRSRETLLGHPKGLFVLFFTELWERFSFYSMRGILTLYTAGVVLAAMGSEAGGRADAIYGAYLGFVYSSTFIGGMLADRLLGQRRAIYIGGTLMALAQFTLAAHALLVKGGTPVASLNWMFFTGLGFLSAGNGFFKPNISTIVGTLYQQGDSRRDAAFTIFYMGINIGAFAASFSAGIAQKYGWHLGFLLAGTGMIVGQLVFALGRGTIEGKGMPPEGASLRNVGRLGIPHGVALLLGIGALIPLVAYLISHPQWVQSLALIIAGPIVLYLLWEATRGSREEAGRMIVILVLCTFSMMFWGFFELAGSTITRFTEDVVNRNIFGTEVQAAFLANCRQPAVDHRPEHSRRRIVGLAGPQASGAVIAVQVCDGAGVPVAGIRDAAAGREGGTRVEHGQMRDDLADPGLFLSHDGRVMSFAGGLVHHYEAGAGTAGGHVHGCMVLVQRAGQRARAVGRRRGCGRRFR